MANYLISSGLLFSIPPQRSGAKALFRRNVQFQSLFTGRGVIAGKPNTAGIVTVNGKPRIAVCLRLTKRHCALFVALGAMMTARICCNIWTRRGK